MLHSGLLRTKPGAFPFFGSIIQAACGTRRHGGRHRTKHWEVQGQEDTSKDEKQMKPQAKTASASDQILLRNKNAGEPFREQAERRQFFLQGSITKILLSTVSFHAGDLLQQLSEMEPSL